MDFSLDQNAKEYDRIYREKSYDIQTVPDHLARIRHRFLDDIEGRLLDYGFGNGIIASYFSREGFNVYGG